MDVVFDGVEYIPGDEEQSLLLTHGLIKAEGKELGVSNPIYKKRSPAASFQAPRANNPQRSRPDQILSSSHKLFFRCDMCRINQNLF